MNDHDRLAWLRRETTAAQKVLGHVLRRGAHLRKSGASAEEIAVADREAEAVEKMLSVFRSAEKKLKASASDEARTDADAVRKMVTTFRNEASNGQ